MASFWSSFALVILVLATSVNMGGAGGSTSVLIINACPYTVWAVIDSVAGAGEGAPTRPAGSFELAPGQSLAVPVPPVWFGRLWGRTDCGGSGTNCQDVAGDSSAAAPAPPVTIAELGINESRGVDMYYAISLVDGYNLPMLVEAAAGATSCRPMACVLNVDRNCPAELRVPATVGGTGGAVACQSPCRAFGAPQFCCVGAYDGPDTCRASDYSHVLKAACPQAISYAFDLAGSVFACRAGETTAGAVISYYSVTFCGPPVRTSIPGNTAAARDQPTTPYNGNSEEVGTEGSKQSRVTYIVAVLGLVTAGLGVVAAVLGFLKKCCFK